MAAQSPASQARSFFGMVGRPAVYTPYAPGSDAITLRAFPVTKADRLPFTSVRMYAERKRFHILRDDVATPVAGSTILVDGTTWTVDAVLPVDGENDAYSLRWSLEVAWGPTLTFTQAHGTVYAMKVDGATAAGLSHIGFTSVPAGVTATVIGDTFKVNPFPETYTISGAITTATSKLAAVPFAPVLAHAMGDQSLVTLTSAPATFSINALVTSYQGTELSGSTVLVTDARVILLSDLMGGIIPIVGDKLTIAGLLRSIKGVGAIYYNGSLIGFDCLVGS